MKLCEQIINLRDKLNKSIVEDANYDDIYSLSVELDNLITQYYKASYEN